MSASDPCRHFVAGICRVAYVIIRRFVGDIGRQSHPAFTFAARMTLTHFSFSLAMNFSNSTGVITIGKPPRAARRALIVGSARPRLTSALSLLMISADVLLGTP